MPSGVADTDVVDLITHDGATGAYVLIMTEPRPWDGSPRRRRELEAKVDTYLRFIRNGQMHEVYPESVGRPVRIRLDCTNPPDAGTRKLLDVLKARLAHYSIRFEVQML